MDNPARTEPKDNTTKAVVIGTVGSVVLISPAFYLPWVLLGLPAVLVLGFQLACFHYQAWLHTELVGPLKLSQPGVSKHLRVLREAGLVEVRPDGRQRWYRLRAEPLAEVDEWLEPYREHWSGRLDALERHLEENP